MFVIENKLLLSYRSVKSMQYPESLKVSVGTLHSLIMKFWRKADKKNIYF